MERREFIRRMILSALAAAATLTEIWQKSWRKLGDSEMAETYPENLGRGKPYPDAKGEN